MRFGLALVCAAALAACAAPASSPTAPAAAPEALTAFVLTRVSELVTEQAVTQAALPTATPSRTPAASATPTPSPVPSATLTPSPTPPPTVALVNFPLPPAGFGGEPHLYFSRPVGAGGNVFVASAYRYGSTGGYRFDTHHGVEFPNATGAPLVAVAPGTVYYAGSDALVTFGPRPSFYGNLVVLELAQPWLDRKVYALYGHMDQVLVQTGQPVNAGDMLGTVGSTGVALGPHLHLEVRVGQPESYWETRNPELWLMPGEGRGTVAVRVTNALGQYLPGMRVGFMCSDGAYRYLDTYWDFGVNPDDQYGENAAMTDVPAGGCSFETEYAGEKLEQSTVVEAGRITFVWLRP